MTTIARRPKPSRYRVVRTWDVETARYMWSVVDSVRMTWARGTSDTGYDNEQEAQAHCEALRAKERT